MFQHNTEVELTVSPECGQTWHQSQKYIPKWKLQKQNIAEESDFVSVADFIQYPFFPITIQPWVCWPEVLFQWVDWAWNQTGITLLSHSGFTRFTYNSLLIVLDHQLILCSQEGFSCTLSTLYLSQTLTALEWWKAILHYGVGNRFSVDCICCCWFTLMLENSPFLRSPDNNRDIKAFKLFLKGLKNPEIAFRNPQLMCTKLHCVTLHCIQYTDIFM